MERRVHGLALPDVQLLDSLPTVLALLDPLSLIATRQSCTELSSQGRSEELWERHCLARYWRLKSCGPAIQVSTWRCLYKEFSKLTSEERWEAEWSGGGFETISESEWFAGSPAPRTNRSSEVRFSVGQVILNRSSPYRGVVAGWDEITKVPKGWPSLCRNRQPWLSKPHYSILVHGGGSTYIVDDNSELERIPGEVSHPLVQQLFLRFNGQVYEPSEALQSLYPEDDALGPLLARRFCNACGAGGAKFDCSICRVVRYCSQECQQQSWLQHQHVCRSARA